MVVSIFQQWRRRFCFTSPFKGSGCGLDRVGGPVGIEEVVACGG